MVFEQQVFCLRRSLPMGNTGSIILYSPRNMLCLALLSFLSARATYLIYGKPLELMTNRQNPKALRP